MPPPEGALLSAAAERLPRPVPALRATGFSLWACDGRLTALGLALLSVPSDLSAVSTFFFAFISFTFYHEVIWRVSFTTVTVSG